MRYTRWILLGVVVLMMSGCAPQPGPGDVDSLTPLPANYTPTPLPSTSQTVSPNHITIWLPPRLAPDTTSPPGNLLTERLNAFQQTYPDIDLDIRVKDEGGPGGLMETLMAASIAAPDALPDVIALNPIDLNTATLKDLIVPLGGLIEEPEAPDWYEHAIHATRFGGDFYGLPIASDAEVLVYRTAQYTSPPHSWSEILVQPSTFIFPAGDPTATFTLAQYLALGGQMTNESGRPMLDPTTLVEVLSFYGSAYHANTLPLSSLQYMTNEETWDAFRAQQASSAVASLNTFLIEGNFNTTSATAIPTRNDLGTSFSETWSWALVTRDPARQQLAAQLLTWLIQPEFLGRWTYDLKLLPPTAAALTQWPEGPESALVSSLVTLATPKPSAEVMATFGPPLRTAIEAVLVNGATPSSAALSAARKFQSPPAE
jgi:ABC-type glycerol-3-phosphate transport system substrate-binding protein